MTTETDPAQTSKDARFKPGNPGRRPGSRNKRTCWEAEIKDDDLRAVIAKVLAAAKEGDAQAQKLILDRMWPIPKVRKISLEIPRVEKPSDIATAQAEIIDAMATGEIDAAEAQQISAVLDGQRRVIETVALETRIAALEGKAGGK